MSSPSESQATSMKPSSGRKSVTIVTPLDATAGSAIHPATSCSSEQLVHHSQPHRKVSFSDVVVTSRQVSVEDITDTPDANGPAGSTAGSGLHEHVTLVDRSIEIPIDDSGHQIAVRLVTDALQDEVTLANQSLISTSLPIYVVRLGMLKQATLYQIEFVIPDSLPAGDVELLRLVQEGPGLVGVPVNVGATVELVECTSVSEPNRGRGQGTPFLRIGIHRIAENTDYPDSDEFTEWPGFVNINDDDEEAADSNALGLSGSGASSALQQLQGGCDAVGRQDIVGMLVDGTTGQESSESRNVASAAQGDKVAEESRMDEQ